MKLSNIGELSLLSRIRSRFASGAKDVIAGIGDDCAVVIPSEYPLLLTTDMMAEGVHFDLGLTTCFQVGFKLISVNVSDIFAMGGIPRFVLLDLAMDKEMDERSIESFYEGVQSAMHIYSVRLVGGDLSSSNSGMIVSAMLVGHARKPVMRSGARPGDWIYVTGNLGDSACGLELLKRIKRPLSIETGETTNSPLAWRTMQPLLERHLLPRARKPGKIARVATSMIDVSDGLFMDLSRLCDESEVGAVIFMRDLPLSAQMRRVASALELEPYSLATSGGEDYELLFTTAPGRKMDAVLIGEITESDRTVIKRNGKEVPFSPEGYQHWH